MNVIPVIGWNFILAKSPCLHHDFVQAEISPWFAEAASNCLLL
jgi:hypothetical protein